MNKYQRLVIVATLMNALLMLLFPPFLSQPLTRTGLPGFDGFYPLLTHFGQKPIYQELLALQLMFVVINGMVAWLVLQSKKHHGDLPEFACFQGIAWFVAINLAVVLSFPPFEPYQTLQRGVSSSFDSFYFLFGSRSHRAIYWPLLSLECLFILINALGHLLLFGAVKRSDDALRERLLRIADTLPDEAVQALADNLRQQSSSSSQQMLGRGDDRRHCLQPRHEGERRTQKDRRSQTAG